MAVTYSGTHVAARSTGTAPATGSITVSGVNPLLMIAIAFEKTASQAINSVTFGGTGTPTLVKTTTNGNCVTAIYCVPAPSGSGIVTCNLSASAVTQLDVALFNGADQSNPCPTGDSQSSISNAASVTLTPTNLVTGDATFGCQGHTISADCLDATPNAISKDSTTNVNLSDGYATNTTAVVLKLTVGGGTAVVVSLASRIVRSPRPPAPLRVSQAVNRASTY